MSEPAVPNSASSKEAPETLVLRAPARPVARLNRRLVMSLVGVGAFAILMTVWWTLIQPPAVPEVADPVAPTAVAKADGLARLPKDYSAWEVPQLGPATGELGRPVLRAEQEAGIRPFSSFRPEPLEDRERVLRLRDQEESQAALKAKVFFNVTRRTAAPVRPEEASGLPPGLPNAMSVPMTASTPISTQNSTRSDHQEQFLDRKIDRTIYATGTLQTPRSDYELLAGTVISAALLTAINSDLPGQVLASVTESVFDSVTGQYLLIPQGSKLIGQYDSEVAFGQARLLLVWTRLIRPDGSSVVLDRLPGMDPQGRAGLEDGVDRHWGRLFSVAALSTLLGVNAELAARNQRDGSIVVATRNSTQDSVNQLGQELTRKNIDRQPTLIIRPGYPLRVMLNRDLVLSNALPVP